MIKTHVRDRASGKTTEIIIRLRENKKAAAIVFYSSMAKEYPNDVTDRVFTFEQLNDIAYLRPLDNFEKIFIDEGFLMTKDKLAKFYFILGRLGLDSDIEVYGSIE